jgi:hypothetical protein
MGYCCHVRKLKLQYWKEDWIVPVVTDETLISLADETDSISTESDTSEDESNDSNLV